MGRLLLTALLPLDAGMGTPAHPGASTPDGGSTRTDAPRVPGTTSVPTSANNR